MVQLNDVRAAAASSTSPTFANVERPDKANQSDNPTLEDLFARMGITTEHARTTATSFMRMLVAVENTSTTAPGGSGRYEVFFAPEDDFCGLSDDGDSSFKFLEDESPDLVNSPAATTAVASTGDLYSSPLALTSSSNTLIASSSPALVPSSLPPADTMVAVVASTGSSAAPPAVALAGTTTALSATPVAPVVAPASTSNATTVTPVGVTASTAVLYALPFVRPANAPLNAIPPPTHLITPIYGYHVPAPNASGPFYTVTRGRDIGIFAGWETASALVAGVSHFTCCRVASIAEGHVRMGAALAANFALYLS